MICPLLHQHGSASVDGGNNYQEDRVLCAGTQDYDLFAVFDGHAGEKAAKFCAKHFPRVFSKRVAAAKEASNEIDLGTILTDVCKHVNEKFLDKREDSGCVASICAISKHNERITVANVGDSRLIVVSQNGKVLLATKDHKPNDSIERERIEKAGHTVDECSVLCDGKRFKVWRVDGEIACARSIGDADYKDFFLPPEEQALCCIPDIYTLQINEPCYCVICCDGVWDVMSNDDVANFVVENVVKSLGTSPSSEEANKVLDEAAQKLVTHATDDLHSGDNTSAIIVALNLSKLPDKSQ